MLSHIPFLITAVCKITLLLAAAWLATLCLRTHSAALRHQVWCLALASVLFLPFLSIALPSLPFTRVAALWPDDILFRADAQVTSAQMKHNSLPAHTQQRLANGGVFLVTLWALGTAISLFQMSLGWLTVEGLRRKAQPITFPEVDRNIDLRLTAAGSMPITYGVFRPVILLPSDALDWSAARRRIVLLHELAHIQRQDGLTHLVARFVLAIYWWHPLVWTAWRESLKEQERAADDMVLTAGEQASDYAGQLLAIARSMHSPTAALAMARTSQLEGRLAAILDSQRTRRSLRPATALASSLLALVILVPVAALHASNSPAQSKPSDNPQVAELLAKGKDALSTKNFDLATSFFDRAQAANPQNPAEPVMWLAITKQNQNDLEASAALYKYALELEAPESPSAATILDLYASVLRRLDRTEEATKLNDQASAIRRSLAARVKAENPPSPDALRVGGDVKAPRVITKIEPKYTEEARLAKYSGAAILAVEIGKDGIARNIRVIRPLGFGLDEKAVEAVKQWKFAPGTLNGEPVVVSAQIEVDFRLL